MSAWSESVTALRGRLDAEFAGLSAWLEVDEELWSLAPGPERWSAAEIVEHVALANHFLSLLARKIAEKSRARAKRGERAPDEPSELRHLDALAGRDFRWRHPEHMTPTGTPSRSELRERLTQQREQLLGLLDALPAGEGALHRIRISVVGDDDRLDLYQLLHFIALHLARHCAQLARNADDFNRARRPRDA
ncbi:MAG: DinB family protein [Planctomycetes bacterium]|nr:DinB family protein [Planctomycetota bacterium]